MMLRVAILYSALAFIASSAMLSAFLFWGYATWPIGDSEAFRLSADGWVKHAFSRAAVSCAGGALFAILALLLLRLTKYALGLPLSGQESRVCMASAAVPTMAGLIGSIQFAFTRPFI